MKKTRLIALAITIALALTALVSCGKDSSRLDKKAGSLGDIYDLSFVDPTALQFTEDNVGEVELSTGVDNMNGRIYYVNHQAKQYAFYRVDTDEVFLRLDLSDKYSHRISIESGEFVAVSVTSEYQDDKDTLMIYNLDGEEILNKKISDSFTVSGNVVKSGRRSYVIADGELKASYKVPEYISDAEITFGEKYAMRGADGYFAFYNGSFELVSAFDYPDNAVNEDCYFLGSEKALVFYDKEAAPDAKDYDYYTDGVKYNTYLAIYDIPSGKASEIEAPIYPARILSESSADLSEYGFSDSVKNVLWYYPIVDKSIEVSDKNVRCAVIGEDGSIGVGADNIFEDQRGLVAPVRNSGAFVYETAFGSVAVDKNGETLGKFEGETVMIPTSFGYLGIADGRVYIFDADLSVVYESNANIIAESENAVILYAYGSGYTRIVGTPDGPEVDTELTIERYLGLGLFLSGNKIYSIEGEELLSTSGAAVSVAALSDNAILIKIETLLGTRTYYRIAK